MSYINKRSAACAAIKRINAAILLADMSEWDIFRVKLEQRTLETHYGRFQQAHEECLADTKDGDMKGHDELTHIIDGQYIEVMAILERRLATAQTMEQTMDIPPTPATPARMEVKLDPVQIPSFDGSLHNWLAFKEAFEGLVHSNAELPEAYKLQKLRTAVLPIHVGMVGNIYSGGYEELWKELTDRFDNPKLLAETHVSRLLNLQPATDESTKAILGIVDRVQETMRALKVMGLPVEYWDALVVPLITSRLPPQTRQAWRLSCRPKELPTLKSLLTYLQLMVHSLNTEVALPSTSQPQSSSSPHQRRNRQPVVMRTHLAATDKVTCVFCEQAHRSTGCPRFQSMDAKKRLGAVREAGACFNCLKKGHSADQCPSSRSCQTCNKRHNTMLCYRGHPTSDPTRDKRSPAPKPQMNWDQAKHGPPDLYEEEEYQH